MRPLTKYTRPLYLALFGTALASCGGGDSSNEDNSRAAGTGGNAASSVTGAGGTSSANDVTNSTSTTIAATAAGDSGGSGGTTSTTGGPGGSDTATTGGAGGASGAGGADGSDSGGSAGSAGVGGTGATGVIGVLGEPCDSPGALGCAGNHQKLTVVCGGDGEWEVNQTCSNDQFCDTEAGVNQGTCQESPAGCVDQEPGHRFCESSDVLECGVDAVSTSVAETCAGVCSEGACDDEAAPCPDPEDLLANCTNECGGLLNCVPSECHGRLEVVVDAPRAGGVIRLPSNPAALFDEAAPPCNQCGTTVSSVAIAFPYQADVGWLIDVEAPWTVRTNVCTGLGCTITRSNVTVGASVLETPAQNIVLQKMNPNADCGS